MPGLGPQLRVLDAQTRRPAAIEEVAPETADRHAWRMLLIVIAAGGAGLLSLVLGTIAALFGAYWGTALAITGLTTGAAAALSWLVAMRFGDEVGLHTLFILGLSAIALDSFVLRPPLDGSVSIISPLLAAIGIMLLMPLRRAAPYIAITGSMQAVLLWQANWPIAPWMATFASMGAFTAFVAYRRDLTESSLERNADAQQRARTELHWMVDNALEAYALVDERGNLVRWNAKCSEWSLMVAGQPAAKGQSLWAGLTEDVAAHAGQCTRIANDGKFVDLSIGMDPVHGERRWQVALTPAKGSEEGTVFAMIREISEADALREDHQRDLHEARLTLLRIASHDLRTPLTPLSMEASLLASSRLGPLTPAQGQAVSVILRNVERLRRYAENLTKANDYEHNPPQAQPQRATLAEILDEAAVEAANLHGVPCPVVGIVDPGLHVVADPELLRSAVVHLVENAATHAPRNTDVVLEADTDLNGAVTVHVHDQGAVPQHDPATRLFEPFYEDWTNADVRTHGLSLHLASKCMELLGGKLEVCQQHSDACFALRFAATHPEESAGDRRPPRPKSDDVAHEADSPALPDDS